ncbi:MAG: ABC transporter substrate-binding protein, partial [Acidimicrobiia bacterium]|nr:ABC transporter substrate-binding protein [Acidimicrobiia bacterium]
MPDRFARTFGASAILVAIVVIGFIQFAKSDDPVDVEIVVNETSTTVGFEPSTTRDDSVPDPNPFVYRIGILQGPSTENFWKYAAEASSVWDTYVLAPTKASLYRVDPSTLELRPELASELASPRWDASGWWVEIELRSDLRWSDGEPITAVDYVFTYETVRSLDLGGNWASAFPGQIMSVEAIDDYALVVRFDGRPGLQTWPYAAGTAPIMARHYWEGIVANSGTSLDLYSIAGSDDVSGGPLDLVEVGAELVVSVANAGYPGQTPDTVEYLVFADESAMTEALQLGTIHSALTPKGLTTENAALLEATDGVRTITTRSYGLRYLGFNLERTPMNTIQFREAVAYLLDREGMAAEFTPDSDPAYTLMPPANDLWFDADLSAEIQSLRSGSASERLELALQGLRTAGYSWASEPAVVNGVIEPGAGLQIGGVAPVPLTILTPGDVYDPARARYAESLA